MKIDYKASDLQGKAVKGILEAKDKNEVIRYLRAKKLIPILVNEHREASVSSYIPFLRRSAGSQLVFFTRQLASMLVAGLTLLQALGILREQVQNAYMKEVVEHIISDIEEGKSFSAALSKHPQVFPSVYISSVKAGETSGLLDKVLVRLADNLEKNAKLKSTIKSALMYPIIVVIGMIVLTLVMMVAVIPQISTLYESLNLTLPLPTLIVLSISRFSVKYWPFMIIGMVGGGYLFLNWRSTETGKLLSDRLVLRIPVFGRLIQEQSLTEFTRTLGLLVGSGTLVVEALRETAGISGNIIYKNAVIGVSKRVEKGIGVGDALLAYPLFPPVVIQMVKVGEETGKLDDSLLRLSEYYEREVDTTVKNLTTAMEPIILLVLGSGVAFLIFAIITPIYGLVTAF